MLAYISSIYSCSNLDKIFSIFLKLTLNSVSKYVNLIGLETNLSFVTYLNLNEPSIFLSNEISDAEIKLERFIILCSKILTFDS